MQVFLQTVVGGLNLGAVYALVALGFALVYRTMGLVNFAHADVLMIGAYIAATFTVSQHLPFAVAVIAAIVITGLIGLFIEQILRPLEGRDFDLMLIGTIGFGIVLESVATLIWGATGEAVPTPVQSRPLIVFGASIPTYDLVVMGVAVAAMLALSLFLERTRRGVAMQAVAMDYDAAKAVGINVGRSNAIAFAIGAGLAALAGALVGPELYVSPSMGDSIGIDGFAAAILGGFGSIPGAVVGAVAVGLLNSFSADYFQGYADLATFVLFAVIVMIKPTGLFGEKTVLRA
jgi:branched-chain amino acid transport system permease protein